MVKFNFSVKKKVNFAVRSNLPTKVPYVGKFGWEWGEVRERRLGRGEGAVFFPQDLFILLGNSFRRGGFP